MRIRFLVIAVVGAVMSALIAVGGASSASAAGTPGCVSQGEYNQVRQGMTRERVTRIFGAPGQVIQASSANVGGVVYRDQIRSYPKCRSFDSGKGRVGVNFDNYMHPNRKAMKVYGKARSNPFNANTNPGNARIR